MANRIIGGVEGGATHTNVVFMNPEGKILSSAAGPGTNHYLIGMDECRRRIADLVNKAKEKAGIPLDTPILALGLSLSGCEKKDKNEELINGFRINYPKLCEQYAIGSDTDGSVAATSNLGGVTCIAGTGSNTLLINPDSTRAQCGGWGNLLGDEAFWIAHKAVKYCIDDLDQFYSAPYPIKNVWNLIKSYFKIENQFDLLDLYYPNMDKPHVASLCKELSEIARNGDELAKYIFERAGADLARSINAVVQKAQPQLLGRKGGVHVLCVGSVWLSYDLLENGFVGYLNTHGSIKEMSLLRLLTQMGVGAALMASDHLGLELKRDYEKNYKVFHHYVKESNVFLNERGCD